MPHIDEAAVLGLMKLMELSTGGLSSWRMLRKCLQLPFHFAVWQAWLWKVSIKPLIGEIIDCVMCETYHREISCPKSATCSATIHTRANHAVSTALRAIEGEVLVFPAHTASETALTELQLDVFDVERV